MCALVTWSADVCSSDRQRASIRELLGALTVPERSAITTVSPPAPKRSSGLSLFRAVKSTRAAPGPYHAPVRNNVLPVGYTTLEAPAPLLDPVGVSLPYRPSRIVFDAAGEHPHASVDSVGMGTRAAEWRSDVDGQSGGYRVNIG